MNQEIPAPGSHDIYLKVFLLRALLALCGFALNGHKTAMITNNNISHAFDRTRPISPRFGRDS